VLPPYQAGRAADCPGAEWLGERGLSLPTWVGMSHRQVQRVAAALVEAAGCVASE
jgi:dTDP-4-amino-4,6-dideoxygalactose transaminase